MSPSFPIHFSPGERCCHSVCQRKPGLCLKLRYRRWKQKGKDVDLSSPNKKDDEAWSISSVGGIRIDIIVGRFKWCRTPWQEGDIFKVEEVRLGAVTGRFARFQPIDLTVSEVLMSPWKGQTLYGRNGNVMLSSKPGSSKLHVSSCIYMSCSSCEQSTGA